MGMSIEHEIKMLRASVDRLTAAIELKVVAKTEAAVPRELLDRGVDTLELSVRAANALQNGHIDTLADLARFTEVELLRIRNCGQSCLREIKAELGKLGLALGMRV